MRRMLRAGLGTAAVLAMVTMSAGRVEAAFIVYEGLEGGSGDVDNVVYGPQCSGNITGPGTTIQGCLNTDPNYLVNFTGDVDIFAPALGQARIEPVEDELTYLHMSPVDGTFSKVQLNINASADGEVTFWALPNGGTSYTFDLDGNGENFFTIIGTSLSEVWLQSTVALTDVRQIRLGVSENGNGPGPDPVSEPTTLALLALGLFGAAGAARARRR
jgi:hypothetical protein